MLVEVPATLVQKMPYTSVVIKYQVHHLKALTTAETEEWNGSAWSEVNDLITARTGTGLGTTEAALLIGGDLSGNTEEWNGTNWSEVAAHAQGAT